MQYKIKQRYQGVALTDIIINTTCTFGNISSKVAIGYINVITIANYSCQFC